MDIERLKNYGKNMHEASSSISPATKRKLDKTIARTVVKALGLRNTIKMLAGKKKARKELERADLSGVRAIIKDESFIEDKIASAVLFQAMANVVGTDKAIEIHDMVLQNVMLDIVNDIFPTNDDFKRFDDPIGAFKRYFTAQLDADRRLGIHDFEIVEDTPDAFQVNITRCGWFGVKDALGCPAAAIPDCDADDVYLGPRAAEFGFKFVRKGTIARGAKVCDFRFKKIE